MCWHAAHTFFLITIWRAHICWRQRSNTEAALVQLLQYRNSGYLCSQCTDHFQFVTMGDKNERGSSCMHVKRHTLGRRGIAQELVWATLREIATWWQGASKPPFLLWQILKFHDWSPCVDFCKKRVPGYLDKHHEAYLKNCTTASICKSCPPQREKEVWWQQHVMCCSFAQ